MKIKRLFLLYILFYFTSSLCFAQENEMRFKLNEEGSQYIKFTFLNQTWLRYNKSNPGTRVNAEPKHETVDIGLRRTRMQLFGQISSRVFFYTQFGMNNFNYLAQNAGNRKLQAFFHDALAEYLVFEGSRKLVIGGGLTILNGLSRFSQPSIGSILTLDVPVFAQATVDQTDEFSRKLSIYARGQVGNLDYRVALSDPFPIQTNGQPNAIMSRRATFSRVGHSKQYQGFFTWNFWEKEPHTTPYMAGTYLGKKKVLNLESGIIAQPDATWTRKGNDTLYHNLLLWSVAAYLDKPINDNGAAISAYCGFFYTDYGPFYYRNNGIMNPANAGGGTNGPGNSYPMFGTGNVLYLQGGYKFKDGLLGKNGTLLPYFSVQNSQFHFFNDPVFVYDIGINWLIKGHNSKLSLDYQSRPVFTNVGIDREVTSRKPSVILQYQVFL